jgi:hypothetical protein
MSVTQRFNMLIPSGLKFSAIDAACHAMGFLLDQLPTESGPYPVHNCRGCQVLPPHYWIGDILSTRRIGNSQTMW